jgi:hypothetical protein
MLRLLRLYSLRLNCHLLITLLFYVSIFMISTVDVLKNKAILRVNIILKTFIYFKDILCRVCRVPIFFFFFGDYFESILDKHLILGKHEPATYQHGKLEIKSVRCLPLVIVTV